LDLIDDVEDLVKGLDQIGALRGHRAASTTPARAAEAKWASRRLPSRPGPTWSAHRPRGPGSERGQVHCPESDQLNPGSSETGERGVGLKETGTRPPARLGTPGGHNTKTGGGQHGAYRRPQRPSPTRNRCRPWRAWATSRSGICGPPAGRPARRPEQEPKATQHRSGTAWRPCSTTWRSCRPEAGSLPATGWIRPTTATTTSPPAAGSSSAGSPRGRASRNSSSSPRPRSPRPGDAGRSPQGRDQGEQHRRADPVEAMMRPPQVDLGPDLSAL
jgi:hypothetical protein